MTEHQDNKNWIWTTLIIAILIGGVFAFIKGWKNAHENTYYAYYNDIKGLQASSPVVMQGATIGKISDIELHENSKVKVSISIRKDHQIPEGTVALLSSGGLTGEKVIQLAPGSGPEMIPDEGILPTAFDATAVAGTIETKPLEMINNAIHFTDSTLHVLNELMRKGLVVGVTKSLIELENETRSFAVMAKTMNGNSDQMVNTIHDFDKTSRDINSRNTDINASIKKAEGKTTELARTDIANNIRNIGNNIDSLRNTLSAVNKNQLLNSNKAYKNTTDGTGKVAKSTDDLKQNPKGFSIFGGKKK